MLCHRKYRRLLIDMEELSPEFLETIKKDTINIYKNIRNQLLLETDKYVLHDFPISPDNLIIIKAYRQQLRDFTNNNYEMPERPEFL